jgi:hypothetical protein
MHFKTGVYVFLRRFKNVVDWKKKCSICKIKCSICHLSYKLLLKFLRKILSPTFRSSIYKKTSCFSPWFIIVFVSKDPIQWKDLTCKCCFILVIKFVDFVEEEENMQKLFGICFSELALYSTTRPLFVNWNDLNYKCSSYKYSLGMVQLKGPFCKWYTCRWK